MDPIAIALRGILPPVLVAIVLGLGGHALARRGRAAGSGATVPLGVGLGFLGAQVTLVGLPALSFDLEFIQSLFPAAVALVCVAVAEALRRRPSPLWRWLLAAALPLWLLDFLWRGSHPMDHPLPLVGGLTVGMGLLLAAGSRLERAPGRHLASIPWIGVGVLSAATLHVSGSSTLGQLEGAWSAALATLWALGRLASAVPLGRWGGGAASLPLLGPGSTLVPLALHGSLLLGGVFAAELAPLQALLLAAAPLGPSLVRGGSRKGPSKLLWALSLAWAFCLAAAALMLALGARPEDPYGGYR
ncbi:MAG TPA: hypothetical protein ENJ09_15625 [Planctomycetes bacterium]|nr:hypothetical protein [Planctomycetota bacterium]